MKRLRYDAVSYVLRNGNSLNKLKLAHILGLNGDRQRLVDELRSLQNRDGGWPWQLVAENPSGVSDTAKVLEPPPSVSVNRTSGTIRRAVSFLLVQQHEDGGWSESPELEGIIPNDRTWISTRHSGYQTADAVNALIESGYLGEAVRRAIDFLRSTQNEEGGWPSHVGPNALTGSDVASTDHVVLAFLHYGEPRESSVLQRTERMLLESRETVDSSVDETAVLSTLLALGYPLENEYISELVGSLIEAQRPDGSWNWFGDLPSNPTQTVDCLEQLVKCGVEISLY